MAEIPASPGPITSYDLTNFVGPLHLKAKVDAVFLAMMGGLGAGDMTPTKLFSWQEDDLADVDTAGKTEASAPSYTGRDRAEFTNITQIIKKGVEVSWSAWQQSGLLDATAGTQAGDDAQGQPILGANPVTQEMAHQAGKKMLEITRDLESWFLYGTFVNPANNATARKTRGIVPAMTTHANDLDASGTGPVDLDGTIPDAGSAFGAAPLGVTYLDDLLKQMYDADATLTNPVVMVNTTQKIKLTQAYTAAGMLAERSNTIGGVAVDTIITDIATVSVVLNRWVNQDELLVIDMAYPAPTWLSTGRPPLGAYPKPSDGDSDKVMFWGEVGLKYGPEWCHGNLDNLTVA
jgi:hypothetical protein